MTNKSKGFFDANPKMLFVFGLVSGIALTMIIGGALPSFNSIQDSGSDTEVVVDEGDTQEPEEQNILAAVTEDDHILGDIETAKIILVEYSDFECSYCGRHHPTLVDLMDTYGDDIAWVYRHFPLSFHEEAVPSALASECAAEQGLFWEFTNVMYENQSELGEDFYFETAEAIGVDIDAFTTCYDEERYIDDIQEDMDTGVAAGVSGTPGNFVNGILVSGAQPASVFEGLIDQLLAE